MEYVFLLEGSPLRVTKSSCIGNVAWPSSMMRTETPPPVPRDSMSLSGLAASSPPVPPAPSPGSPSSAPF